MKELIEACASTRHLSIEKAVVEITSSLLPTNIEPEDDLVLLGVEV